MLCCVSDLEKRQRAHDHSKQIDQMLHEEYIKLGRTNTFLFLGAQGSGKRTFLKQIRIIHGEEFNEEEVREYRSCIYGNILEDMQLLIEARNKLDIPLTEQSNSETEQFVLNFAGTKKMDLQQFSLYVEPMKKLWQDGGIRNAFDQTESDSLRYFMENLERIVQKDYTPLQLDILQARKATEAINELRIEINSVPFYLIDIRGMQGQKKKIFHCFETATSIFFMVSCDEFDQVFTEDGQTNRLVESCNLFETISNHYFFNRIIIILLMNKMDLLEEKIKHVNIKDYMPEFTGNPHEIEDVKQFLKQWFLSRCAEREIEPTCYFIKALNTENIKYTFKCAMVRSGVWCTCMFD